MGIGSIYKKLVKQKIFGAVVRNKAKSCGKDLHVNYWSVVNRNTVLGNNVNFNGLRIAGNGPVSIGDNFHSGRECLFETQNHNFEGNAIPYDDTYILKDIIIEENVWLGDRVMILGGVTVGEGAIIQAGAVVVSDIPPCAIAGGNPAKVFKYRNQVHYYQLKEKQAVH